MILDPPVDEPIAFGIAVLDPFQTLDKLSSKLRFWSMHRDTPFTWRGIIAAGDTSQLLAGQTLLQANSLLEPWEQVAARGETRHQRVMVLLNSPLARSDFWRARESGSDFEGPRDPPQPRSNGDRSSDTSSMTAPLPAPGSETPSSLTSH